MRDTSAPSFLGIGWSFPPRFDSGSGEPAMSRGVQDIDESLRILLGTEEGERFLNPTYGLDLRALLFEPLSTTMATLMKDRIRTAILIYEPRINLLNVEVDASRMEDGFIAIVLDYEVRATNSRYNLVYPYYLTDSSEVRGVNLPAKG